MSRVGVAVGLMSAMGVLGCSLLVSLTEVAPGPGDASLPGSDSATPDASSSGCDANLANDPTSCGSCRHDCLGGACLGGSCQPIVIAQSIVQPEGLWLTSSAIYVGVFGDGTGDGGSIVTMALDGGNRVTTVPTTTRPRNVTADGQHVYWVETVAGGSVMTANLDGTASHSFASGTWTPEDVKVDSSAVFWVTAEGDVFSCPIAGCAGLPKSVAKTTSNRSLALDMPAVYWTDPGAGTVYEAPKIGGLPLTLATGLSSPLGIALDLANVYWTDFKANTVMQCPKSSCAGNIVTLATSQSGADGIAVDGTTAYWANLNGGTVSSCPIGTQCGGSPRNVPGLQSYPLTVAVDDVAIYWTNSGGATVSRLAK